VAAVDAVAAEGAAAVDGDTGDPVAEAGGADGGVCAAAGEADAVVGAGPDVPAGAAVCGAEVAPPAAGAAAPVDGAATELMATAKAVRLARTEVSFAWVSSSRLTDVRARDGATPEVPVGLGSLGLLAPIDPVAGAAASSSPRILSAAAASLAQVALLPLVDAAGRGPAAIFTMASTCFLSWAICAVATPLTEADEMLFNVASALCRCSCGLPDDGRSCAVVMPPGAGAAGSCAKLIAGTARKPANTIAAHVDVHRFIVLPS
jgi:hypothetical protein